MSKKPVPGGHGAKFGRDEAIHDRHHFVAVEKIV
jgi:hypothetical protein